MAANLNIFKNSLKKKMRFIQIEQFFGRSSLGEMKNQLRNNKKNILTLWAV